MRTGDESPQYTSPSEDSELEYLRNTQGQGIHQERVRQSLKLNTSLVQRALGTFSMSDPIKNREQGSITSQASRITDSAQETDKIHNIRLNKEEDKIKRKQSKVATKQNLDADSVNEANKPLTIARAKILASQDYQVNDNQPPATTELIPTHAPAPSGSRLTIKRIKN